MEVSTSLSAQRTKLALRDIMAGTQSLALALFIAQADEPLTAMMDAPAGTDTTQRRQFD
jgi:hypothetical protein